MNEEIEMQTKIYADFWSDPDIELTRPQVKLAALWMMTNDKVTMVGWSRASKRQFVYQTGLNESFFDDTIKELGRCFVATSKGYWIRKYCKYQWGTQESMISSRCFKAFVKALDMAEDPILVECMRTEYPIFCRAVDLFKKEVTSTIEGACKPPEKEKEKEKENGKGCGEGEITADRIYSLYPRKVGRPMAIKAIRKALSICPPAELLGAVSRYAQAVQGEDPTFIPHPSTWFNQERFNDHPSTWIRGNGRGKSVYGMKPAKRNPSLEEVLKKDAALSSDSKKYGGEK
jgi:hypothetical protein